MRYKIFTVILLGLLMVNGCISEFHVDLPEGNSERLVVEGNIIANSDSRFYLSKSIPLGSSEDVKPEPVTNARLIVAGSDGYKSNPATHIGEGIYDVHIGNLSTDIGYNIEIEYDGDTYQSEPAVPIYTPEIESITWVQPQEYGEISVRVSNYDDNQGFKYYLWNYEEDWETTAEYRNRFYYDPVKDLYYETPDYQYFYCWDKHVGNEILLASTEALTENRIVNQELFTRSSDDMRFWELYAVKVSQIAISKDAYDYFYHIKKQNVDMGGLFTPQPSDIQGNIACITNPDKKTVGYVSVTTNLTGKRIFITPDEITFKKPTRKCTELSDEEVKKMLSQGYTLPFLYNTGWRPQGFFTEEGGEIKTYIDFWAPVACMDCREERGTKNKPDFWPNNHE